MIEEEWRTIFEFPDYMISNLGDVYNKKRRTRMSVSQTNHGHSKITLTDASGDRMTRSVAVLVAQAFLEPPNLLCDQVVVLDGDLTNLNAENLAWRPTWFAWKYVRQLKETQPVHFRNLRVHNTDLNIEYDSIMEAGVSEGLLFQDIWRSTYTGEPVYPTRSTFEVVERV